MSHFINNSRLQSLVTAGLSGLLLIGCLNAPEEDAGRGDFARLGVDIRPGKSSTSSATGLGKVIVTLTSSAGETLRDTITEAGSRLSEFPVRLNPATEETPYVNPLYALNPLHAWTITVKTLDARGTVLHLDSSKALELEARRTRNVTMRLASRFAAYEAVFSLPASLAKTSATLDRVELAVDGVTFCDTLASGAAVKLTCNDLPAGNHTVTLRAFGRVAGAAPALLFQGEKDVNINASSAPVESVTLAPAQGGAAADQGMSVRLGRVGQVVMNVVISGGVVL